ncbi:MAG: CapA family protein, partial [Candidatus Aminicenantes bacterium]
STTYEVTGDQMKALRQVIEEFGMRVPKKDDALRAFDRRFIKAKNTAIRTDVNKEDMEEIAAVVRNASGLADYTIVTIHAHESDRERSVPAKFLVTFARAMIDAGADVFVGHGPHVLRGIEIYKGRPILYSLSNFIFQNETLDRLPYENYERYRLDSNSHVADFNDKRYNLDRRGFPSKAEYWESIIAVPAWKGKDIVEIKLYPVTLGFGKPRTARGRPLFADEELSKKIIDDLQRLSEPFGTIVEYQDGIGILRFSTKKDE